MTSENIGHIGQLEGNIGQAKQYREYRDTELPLNSLFHGTTVYLGNTIGIHLCPSKEGPGHQGAHGFWKFWAS